jgi:hypothetical protein
MFIAESAGAAPGSDVVEILPMPTILAASASDHARITLNESERQFIRVGRTRVAVPCN